MLTDPLRGILTLTLTLTIIDPRGRNYLKLTLTYIPVPKTI